MKMLCTILNTKYNKKKNYFYLLLNYINSRLKQRYECINITYISLNYYIITFTIYPMC